MTPNSSSNAYLTAADFLARKDLRSVAQFCSDDPNNPVPDGSVATNPNLLAALNAASGMLESAVLTSERYSVSDLQSLSGVSSEYMKSLLADIGMYLIMTRRPGPSPPETVVTSYEMALQALDALSRGERIFAFSETEQAGLPDTYQMTMSDQYRDNMWSVRNRRWLGNGLNHGRFL